MLLLECILSRVKLFNRRVTHRWQLNSPNLLAWCKRCSFLLLLEVGEGDTVHVHDSLLSQALTHGEGLTIWGLELGSSDNVESLKLSEAVSEVLSSSLTSVLGLGSTSGLGSVVLTETGDTDLTSHVDLVSNRSGTGVEPVLGVWRKFLEAASLNDLSPLYVFNIIKLET